MSTALTAQYPDAHPAAECEQEVSLPLRGDTFLGVFEAIGQDLGFNPNWLRVPFGALILWNPPAIIGSYIALGGVVALSRWLYPVSKSRVADVQKSDAGGESVENRESEELLAA